MKFSSTFTQESASCPGVKFTMRVLNQMARAARDAELVEARTEIATLFAQMNAIPDPELEVAEMEAAAKAQERELEAAETEHIAALRADPENTRNRIARARLDHRIGLIINSVVKPAYIRASLARVTGLEIDGGAALDQGEISAPPWDRLLADGPDALIEELYAAAVMNSGLTEATEKN